MFLLKIRIMIIMKRFSVFAKIILLSLALFSGACTHFGSFTLAPDRISYNKTIINSELQQVLLNLVRLRFGDTPQFVSLNSIVSSFNFSGGLSGNWDRSVSTGSVSTGLSASPTASVSESPTLTYTPMQGEEFVTRLLTPLEPQVIKLFLRDGWGIARVLRVVLQKLGPLENALIASRPTSSRFPVYQDFASLTRILRKLQWAKAFKVENDNSDGTYRMHLIINNFKILDANEKAFLKRLGIIEQMPDFWITTAENDNPRNFYAETRTMLAIYNYLAKGVNVPPDQMKYIGALKNKDGSYFDWQKVVGGLIDVKYSKFLPKEAYIYVYYRGYYFYIDDIDTDTKETMNLLFIINGIFQGNIQSVLPVFTVSSVK